MKVDRLFKIMYILLDKNFITAEELANQLEVSVRTIYRDIDSLSMAGMPIYTSSGVGGGIGILENFVLNKSHLTEEEQEHILLALENLSPTDSVNIDKTLDKLKTIFHNNNTSWIEVDYSRWGIENSDKDNFNLLKNAVLNHNEISFTYYSSYVKQIE